MITWGYEFVKRAMPGFCYRDVERTIYVTYYVLMEDRAKYDAFFAEKHKFSASSTMASTSVRASSAATAPPPRRRRFRQPASTTMTSSIGQILFRR